MGFLRLTAEGVEEAARSETDTVAFTFIGCSLITNGWRM